MHRFFTSVVFTLNPAVKHFFSFAPGMLLNVVSSLPLLVKRGHRAAMLGKLGSLSKSLLLVLLRRRLPWLKRSGESTSRWSAKFYQSEIQRWRKHELKSLKSISSSFSQSNGFAQRTAAFIRLARTSREFLSESECHILCTITTFLDEISNLWDKYLKEYRMKDTDISIQKQSSIA